MEKRTEGAWLVHHTKKLNDATDTQEFEEIELAGKCGIFLSNLAASDQSELNSDKVAAVAKVSNIKLTEIRTIKSVLQDAHLIQESKNGGIAILGLTNASVLEHTADIFQAHNPSNFQKAALDLSENISDMPKGEKFIREFISDTYKLSADETSDVLQQSEGVGFIDYETLDDKSKFYFNGNIFRKDGIAKTNAVLASLSQDDTRKIVEVDALLERDGCTDLSKVETILGDQLLSKLQAIGMYDFQDVSNPRETKTFVTKPSAFAKFGKPFEEDALDLAKTFVSALYYGMKYSPGSRGRIQMLSALMRKLINGREVGPATAIGQDYQLLEFKRVVQLRHAEKGMYYMKLLKRDIGELALQVLEKGMAVEQSALGTMTSGSITEYVGPEKKRTIERKKQTGKTKTQVANLLRTFRQ